MVISQVAKRSHKLLKGLSPLLVTGARKPVGAQFLPKTDVFCITG